MRVHFFLSLPVVLSLVLLLATPSAWSQNKTAPAKAAPVKKELKADDSSARREFSDEELEKKFFNSNSVRAKVAAPSSLIYMPVFYERMEHPLARIKSRATNQLRGVSNLEVDGHAMVAILGEIVADTWSKKIKETPLQCKQSVEALKQPANADATCWVSLSTFDDPEVKIQFNEQLLEIRIRVPPELRTKKITSLLHYGSFDFGEATNEPSWFSSYLNMNLSQDFRSDAVELKNGRQPLAGHYDSGTRFGELVIEANARSLEKRPEIPTAEPAFIREDVRAVVDFPGSGNRSQLGDLNYPVRGFQAYRTMAGASLFTQLTMQSSQLTLPTGSYEINLKRPSKVAIYINDQIVQTISLPAGRHNLRDFPFVIGLNDLRLEITDDVGMTEVLNYTYFSSNELLKVGQNELSYAVGAPWTEVAGERVYDTKQTTFTGFHRYGYSQNLSLGANVQTDPDQTMGGLEFLLATTVGYFSIEPAYSLNKDHPGGYAGRVRYIVQDSSVKEKNNRFTTFEISSFSPDFAPLGIRDPVNPVAIKLQASHSRALSKTANLNFSVGYNFNRRITSDVTDSYTLSVGGTKRWFDGFSTNINFRHTRIANSSEEISTLLYLVWAFPSERQFVTASTESASGTTRADWTYQPSAGVGGLTSRVNIQNKQTGGSYGESIDYSGNRFRISESHQVDIIKEDRNQTPPVPQRSIHATNLQLASAVVFAGGKFALSRPVTDSFAIIIPQANLRDQNVLVNPQFNGTYATETDWLGSAVVSDIPSYSMTSIVLGQKNLKQGASLPQDHFNLKPTYRSGYAISIGTDATVYLKTKLLHMDETPVSMIAAQAIYVDDASKEPVMVFTNRSGLLRSEGFRPGRYRLEITESDYEPVEFTIPETATEEFEMPALHLKVKGK